VTEAGETYNVKGEAQVLYFPGGFELVAPWGELQRAPEGYLLLNGEEVYANSRETFVTRYEIDRR
jgi:hypothetical protein